MRTLHSLLTRNCIIVCMNNMRVLNIGTTEFI
jgi:hypothetical protein